MPSPTSAREVSCMTRRRLTVAPQAMNGTNTDEKVGRSSGGGKEVSLSVEETNRLRAQIGLKPLRTKQTSAHVRQHCGSPSHPINAPPLIASHLPPKNGHSVEGKSLAAPSVAAVAVLGLDDDKEDDSEEDTGAWVARMRQDALKETKPSKRPRVTDFQAVSDPGAQKGAITVDGVKVEHGALDSITADNEAILTLADAGVLDESGKALNGEKDVLVDIRERENARMRESSRLRTGAALKELEYDPTDDMEFTGGARNREHVILGKYNGQQAGITSRVIIDGSTGRETVEERQRVAERLRLAQAGLLPENIQVGSTFESDFYTKDEYAAKFKKKSSRKSLKKRNAVRTSRKSSKRNAKDREGKNCPSASIPAADDDGVGSDGRASGDDEAKRIASLNALREVAAAEQRRADFEEEEDDGEFELQESLARARRLANQTLEERRMSTGVDKLLEVVKCSVQESPLGDGSRASGETSEVPVILTETEQFVRTIGASASDVYGVEDVPCGSGTESSAEGGANGTDSRLTYNEDGVKGGENAGGSAKHGSDADRNPLALEGFEDDEEQTVKPMGLAHTLARLRTLGQLNQQREQSGRVRDERADLSVPGDGGQEVKLSYKDDQGRDLTPKEAFRIMSHKFHGKGPGQNKREALMRRQMRNMELRQKAVAEDTPLASVAALAEETMKTKSAHVVLSGAAAISHSGALETRGETPVHQFEGDSRIASDRQGRGTVENAGGVSARSADALISSSGDKHPRSQDKVEFSLGASNGSSAKRTRRL